MPEGPTRNSADAPAEFRHEPTRDLYGWITHTDLLSSDPVATKQWCATVFDWKFNAVFPGPTGDYHLFAYSEKGGGGIRATAANEQPGSMPFVHVENVNTSFATAVAAGAEAVLPPQSVADGVGLAIVRAPGGVLLGLSGPSF